MLSHMTTPRYVPREYIAPGYRTLFGKTPVVPWASQTSPARLERLEAARMQHLYALVIRDRIKSRHRSIRDYAAAVGQDEQRLARVLRGQTVMRLDDIGTANVALGDVHGAALRLLSPSESDATQPRRQAPPLEAPRGRSERWDESAPIDNRGPLHR